MSFPALVLFPLYPIVEGRCACPKPDCTNAGKHPAVDWGALTESVFPPGHTGGYGIKCGPHYFVVDEDELGAWVLWLAAHGEEVHPTLTIRTPRGRHYVYTLPDGCPAPNTIKQLGPKLDTRGEGGYVVAPHSPHVSGGTYTIETDMDPQPAPLALVTWLTERQSGGTAGPTGNVGDLGTPDEDTTNAVVATFKAAWPESGRHLAQRALAGALVSRGYAPDWVTAVLTAIAGDPGKRANTVAATVKQYTDGGATEGWTRLGTIVPLTAIHEVQGHLDTWAGKQLEGLQAAGARLAEARKVTMADARKTAKAHEYTFPLDYFPSTDRKVRRATPQEITWALAADEDWIDVLRLNELTGQVEARRPPMPLDCETKNVTNADLFSISRWFDGKHGLLASAQDIRSALLVVARTRIYNPVKEYLESCPPPEEGAIQEAMTKGFSIKAEEPIYRTFFRKQLIAAVARVYSPGQKVDTCLVLTGPQDAGKSTMIQCLFPVGFKRISWTNKEGEVTRLCRGAWCVEFDELDGLRKADVNTLKAWLSRQEDTHVKKFEENANQEVRGFVPFGTSNETEILRDATGERRWWVVPIHAIDLTWFTPANVARVWAEAVQAYRDGERWWLDTQELRDAAAKEMAHFKEIDPVEDDIKTALRGKDWVSPVDIACKVFSRAGQPMAKAGELPPGARKRVITVLKLLGCTEHRKDGRRGYAVPPEVSGPPLAEVKPWMGAAS